MSSGRRPLGHQDRALDSVDELLDDWARERPDLDFLPVGIVTRLARVRAHLDAGLQRVFDRYDLSAADFVVIVSLRRAAAPYRLQQAQLMQRLGLTSGTVSVRIDRLVRLGVVIREPDATDRRVQLVRLTEQGLRLFDQIAPVHLANEDRLLSALDNDQRHQLAHLLRILLDSFEQPTITIASLGLELLQAHAARARRTAVGLSDTTGLLVAAPPVPGSVADLAGLQRGDLITSINGTEVRSRFALAEALSVATQAHLPLTITYLRKDHHQQARAALPRQGDISG